ncbi:hypothetical protein PGTUg99_000036, partial [Puccinia graminis f. sp. tritici]
MNVEDTRTEKGSGSLSALSSSASKNFIRPNKDKFKALNLKTQSFKMSFRTKNRSFSSSSSANQPISAASSKSDVQKLINNQIQLLKKLQVQDLNAINESESDNHEEQAGIEPQNRRFLTPDFFFNLKPINKKMKTYSG